MRRFTGFLVWILIIAGGAMAVCQSQAAVVTEQELAAIPITHDISLENAGVREMFLHVLRGTGVHGGLAEIRGCSALPKGRLRVKQGSTLSEAMNALVAASPSYQWDVEDGVVNLMPRAGVPLLRTRVVKYNAETTTLQIPSALGGLLNLPEVRERETALGLKLGPGYGGLGSVEKHPIPKKPVPVHINLQNLSLLDAFNEILQASPKGVWIYRENDCDGAKTFTIYVTSGY